MPFFLVPSPRACETFLSHPHTYHVHFPTSHQDLYFPLPFPRNCISTLSPSELQYLKLYLYKLSDSVGAGPTYEPTQDICHIQDQADYLPGAYVAAWEEGVGYPVFDGEYNMLDFVFDDEMLEFHGAQCEDNVEVRAWEKNGLKAIETRRNGSVESFQVYGGIIKSRAQWQTYAGMLTWVERSMLEHGYGRIESGPMGGLAGC